MRTIRNYIPPSAANLAQTKAQAGQSSAELAKMREIGAQFDFEDAPR